jgi:hypothetical protein
MGDQKNIPGQSATLREYFSICPSRIPSRSFEMRPYQCGYGADLIRSATMREKRAPRVLPAEDAQ